jgi:hypothetical protein
MQTRILQFTAFFLGAYLATPTSADPLSADPLSEEEINGLLEELSVIEDFLTGERVSLRTSAVHAFEAASSSDKAAYEFYVQCHKTLNFDAKDSSFSEFRAWREKNEDKINNKENLAAIRFQLQYLVLTMKAAEGVKRETLIPELENFVTDIVADTENLGGMGMRTLRSSVKSTIFAEAYKLNKSLEVDNWSFEPGNFGEVYDQSVFPFFRKEAPEALSAAWDRRINLEKQSVIIRYEDNDYELEKFETERLPELYWAKATDIYINVSPKQGSQAMLAMLKGNPGHTSLKKWLEQFRDLLATTAEQSSAVPVVDESPSNE